jgi:hypothetical protein
MFLDLSSYCIYLVDKDTLSFSDNNQQLILSDLSESSETSGSDGKSSLRFSSAVSKSGLPKKHQAQDRKSRKELILKCNKKIYYFIEKYAKMDAGKMFIQNNNHIWIV